MENIKTLISDSKEDRDKVMSLFRSSPMFRCTNESIKSNLERNGLTGYSENSIGRFFKTFAKPVIMKVGGKMYRGWRVEYIGS